MFVATESVEKKQEHSCSLLKSIKLKLPSSRMQLCTVGQRGPAAQGYA
jgi:hypothetical protein